MINDKRALCNACWGSKKLGPSTDPFMVELTLKGGKCGLCSGTGTVGDTQLSDHFWMSEFVYSQTAVRKGIPNVVTFAQRENLEKLCRDLLEPVRNHFGPIRINSGHRSPALNRALSGSSKTSAHMEANAADLDPINPKVRFRDVIDWVIEEDLNYDQVIYEGTWIHLGRLSPAKTVRKEKLMMFPELDPKTKKMKTVYSKYDSKDARVNL